MKRIIIICEGETEQAFCKTTLAPYLIAKDVYIDTPLIKSSRGGIVKWSKLKDQIERHLKEDSTAIATTLVDYYGLYSKYEFPNWDSAEAEPDKCKRMTIIEEGMKAQIDDDMSYRFIPYVQLHEFEGLLFNEESLFFENIPNDDIVDKAYLNETFHNFDNPELINCGKETSPSHRLQRIIKGYNKIVYGDIIAEAIGMERLLNKSPRFKMWVEKLSSI